MVNILGMNLSELKAPEVLAKIADFLNSSSQHYIVTPNPEIILEAHRDEEFHYILNQADLALADGFGLKLTGWLSGHSIPRVTGADLTLKLLEKAEQEGIKILILNWEEGLSSREKIAFALKQKYPRLNFSVLDINRDKFLTPEIIEKIKAWAPKILFSTLGFPYQEKNIYHNLNKLPSVKVALGIGGSFDFITGQTKRAPKILRRLGLEWFWRLLKQPKRLKRIYNATFIFLGKFLDSRLIKPFLYRPNVACLLYKKELNNGQTPNFKILIIERRDDPNHWQLPQGGRDGQNPEEAGARELREEIGTDKFIPREVFKNVYRYKFGKEIPQGSRFYIRNYKGQKQDLLIAEFTGLDSDIKVCFWDHVAWKWVDADNLAGEVHKVRRPATTIFLAKFKSLNL